VPTAPYLIFGFDVDPSDPAATPIIKQVHDAFPLVPGIGSLGVENVYLVEVAPSQAFAAYHTVAHYLWQQGQAVPALRWFAQLCGNADIAMG
jgi:hypothetical protein